MGVFSSDNTLIGIDVGSTAVRLVQLRKGSGKPTLVSFASAEVPGNLAMSDSKLDMQTLAQIISKLIKSAKINTKNVITALPGASVFSTVIKMPPMSQAELSKAVKYQAEQNIPLKIEDVKIDYQVVRENPATKELAVMIVAAPKMKIERTLELFSMAELDVEYLETSPISIARALSNPADPIVMIVDIGASYTQLSIVENGVVTQVRTLQAAGLSLTRVISKNLGLDATQAEQFKRRFGLSQDKLEGQIYRTIKPLMSNITDEIERSMTFYQNQFGTTVQKIVLTGGGSRIPEIVTYLKSIYNIEVVYGNPWEKVSFQPELAEKLNQISPEFACAIGLALREL